jgi:hypothetical protein
VIVVVAEELVMLPDQPAKIQPEAGVALSVTTVSLRYEPPEAGVNEPFPTLAIVSV